MVVMTGEVHRFKMVETTGEAGTTAIENVCVCGQIAKKKGI